MTQHRRRSTAAPAPRPDRTRVIGHLAIAAILPYLLLKIAWIAGSTVGIVSASPVDAAVLQGGNLVTAAMEVVAVLVILTFTRSWGLSVPPWLVLAPTWIGTGLLAPFVVTGPVVAVSVLGDPTSVGDGSLAAWVGPLVYLSFGAQAIGLSAAFLGHVRARWSPVFTSRIAAGPAGPARPVALASAWAATTLLSVVVVARVSWACGSTWGLPASVLGSRGIAEQLADGGTAVFAVAAAVGTLSLLHRRPRAGRTWVPLCLAWVGTGAIVGSGLYATTLLLSGITGPVSAAAGAVGFVDLLQTLAGTVLAVVGASLLAGMAADRAAPSVRPAEYAGGFPHPDPTSGPADRSPGTPLPRTQ